MPTKQRLTTEQPFIEPQSIPTPVPQTPPPEEFADLTETRRLVDQPAGEKVYTPTDEERAQFATLMACGKRSKKIDVLGHTVAIESLNVDDDLRIGMFTKEYLGSDAYARAIQVGTCAAGIRSIDGRLLYTPISSDETPESIFSAKAEKLLKFYPVAITQIYREILNLDAEFAELAAKLNLAIG